MATLEMKKPVQDELAELTKKRDQLKIDIENMRHLVNQETEKKVMDARRFASSVEESRLKLEKDKVDLEKMAATIKSERAELSRLQERAAVHMADAKAQMEHVGAFILLVRREAEKL